MRLGWVLFSSVWLAFSLLTAPVAAEAPAVRRYALVASNNDGGADRPRLRFANSDATAMAEVLRSLGGVRSEDLVLLTSVRRSGLKAAFDSVTATLGATPRAGRRELFVYYSGHSDEQGLLLGGERVGYRELRSWVDAVGAEVRIVVLDSCASGALIRSRGGTRRPSFLSDVSVDARGHAFLTASASDEDAQESDRIGAGFFSHYLLSGLRGAADTNQDGLVTLAEAYQFSYQETLRGTEQSARTQHPAYDFQLAGQGDLVLTDVRATNVSLVLADDVWGRVFVRSDMGRLMAELRKDRGAPVTLGLAPGRYEVSLERDGARYQASVDLRAMSTTLGAGAFQEAPTGTATARGVPDNEDSSLIGSDSLIGGAREFGGYAAVGLGYARLGGADALMASAEVALLINRRVTVGVAGAGGVGGESESGDRLVLGLAGAVFRYQFLLEAPFSVSLGAIAGAGTATTESDDAELRDGVFWVEPQLGGHVSVTRFWRVGVDAGYRFVGGVERHAVGEVRSPTVGMHMQVGWF